MWARDDVNIERSFESGIQDWEIYLEVFQQISVSVLVFMFQSVVFRFFLASLFTLPLGEKCKIRANAMISQVFGSSVGPKTVMLDYELNFRLVSLTFYSARLITLANQIK